MFTRETKMTNQDKAELKKEILKVTPVIAKVAKKTKAKVAKLSKKAQEVQKALQALTPDWRPGTSKGLALKNLMEAVMGEKIADPTPTFSTDVPRIDKSNLRKFQLIVPEGHAQEHSYPLGQPILLLENGGSVCLKADGEPGDNVRRSSCRYATSQEVDTFLDKLQKNATVENLMKYLA